MQRHVSHDSEKLTRGQQVITACAFIHNEFEGVKKVFFAKRAYTKKFLPGVYELPGGHIDFGEDVITGLKREIAEEFNMKINVGDPFYTFAYKNEVKGSHSIEVVYFSRFIDPIADIKLNFEDHSEYGWFAESELNKAFSPSQQKEDPEFKAISKGFFLLKGNNVNFG